MCKASKALWAVQATFIITISHAISGNTASFLLTLTRGYESHFYFASYTENLDQTKYFTNILIIYLKFSFYKLPNFNLSANIFICELIFLFVNLIYFLKIYFTFWKFILHFGNLFHFLEIYFTLQNIFYFSKTNFTF